MATVATAKKTDLGNARAEISRLTTYAWEALDKRGQKMRGEMQSKNASLVKAELRRQGMNPQSVKERAKPLFGSAGSKVTPRDVAGDNGAMIAWLGLLQFKAGDKTAPEKIRPYWRTDEVNVNWL